MILRNRIVPVVAGLVCSLPAAALDYSGSVLLATDYAFRGISQTDQRFAIQGSLDVEHETGLYAGAWASNVDFNDGDEASTEVNLYTGYTHQLSKSLSGDLNFLYYLYPGADDDLDYDYYEITPALSYAASRFTLEGKVSYSPEFFADSGSALYYQGNLSVPLPASLELGLHGGYQDIDENDTFGAPDYTDWSATLSRPLGGFGAALSYVDTDLDDDECFGGTGLCDERVIFSLARDI